MTNVILKTVLWGVVAWFVLSILLFFAIGFYQGLVAEGGYAGLSVTAETGLRYFVLLLALGVASTVFILEEKKQKPFKHIVAEEKPQPKKEPAFSSFKKEQNAEFHGTVMPQVDGITKKPDSPQPQKPSSSSFQNEAGPFDSEQEQKAQQPWNRP